jgi:hypothetical protein
VSYDLTYIALKKALTVEGCSLCRLREHSGRKYLSWLLHEQVNDMATRLRLAESWGFCSYHAWQFQELEWKRSKDGMGTAILWEWLVERYRAILRQHLEVPVIPKKRLFRRWPRRRRSSTADQLLRAFAPQGSCPVCASQQHSERYALWVLSQHLAVEESFRALYKQSTGLCMPHFRVALEAEQDEQVVRFLLEIQLETLTRLGGELGEYLRKHDYRFAHEPYGSEADAFIRATEILVGKKPQREAHE